MHGTWRKLGDNSMGGVVGVSPFWPGHLRSQRCAIAGKQLNERTSGPAIWCRAGSEGLASQSSGVPGLSGCCMCVSVELSVVTLAETTFQPASLGRRKDSNLHHPRLLLCVLVDYCYHRSLTLPIATVFAFSLFAID
jgi:hypothetical protein